MQFRPLLLVLAALLPAACGTSNYYLLPEAAPAAARRAPVSTVVVAELSLPTYVDAIELAVLQKDGVVSLEKKELWADTPRRAMTRHLANALDQRLSAKVSTEPWPSFDAPGLRVEVTVDRMIGTPDGSLDFAGQYFVTTPASGRIVFERALRHPGASPGSGICRAAGGSRPRARSSGRPDISNDRARWGRRLTATGGLAGSGHARRLPARPKRPRASGPRATVDPELRRLELVVRAAELTVGRDLALVRHHGGDLLGRISR